MLFKGETTAVYEDSKKRWPTASELADTPSDAPAMIRHRMNSQIWPLLVLVHVIYCNFTF